MAYHSLKTRRYVRASIGILGINQIHYTNPWIVAAWSFFLPGCGHMLVGKYIHGWILLIWELLLNIKANFNTAIMYSFTGRFQEAAEIMRGDGELYIILYGTVYIFILLNSYKLAVEANSIYYLANQENAPIQSFKMNCFDFNMLSKSNPLYGALWSLLTPGLGGIFNSRLTSTVIEIILWCLFVVKSHTLEGIMYSAAGNFSKTAYVMDPEWLLFMPSIYSFLFYLTYVTNVERNKLFDKEQSNFLKQCYQLNPQFPLVLKGGGSDMRFIASFDHSIYLEKALVALEEIGVPKTNLFAAPLDKRNQDSVWFDTLHRADGKSLLDSVALLGALGCALGTIYGFILTLGPVLWGLIGFFGGCLTGGLIELGLNLIRKKKREKVPKTEVILIVDYEQQMEKSVEKILWNNRAFGISRIESSASPINRPLSNQP